MKSIDTENILHRLEARYMMSKPGNRQRIADAISFIHAEMRKAPPKLTIVYDRVAMTITWCYGFPDGTGDKAYQKLMRNVIHVDNVHNKESFDRHIETSADNPLFHTIVRNSEED